MIAENNKISLRQITRWSIFAFSGILTGILPTALAGESGADGVWSIAGGTLVGVFIVMLTLKCTDVMHSDYPTFLKNTLGNKLGTVCQIFYLIYFVIMGGYVLYLLSDMVLQKLLGQESFPSVLLVMLGILAYSVYTGVESSARVYEIMFGFVTFLVVLILLFAVRGINADYYRMLCTEPVSVIAYDGYRIVGIMSWITLLLFFFQNCYQAKRLRKAAFLTVIVIGVTALILYLVLIGAYGAASLSETAYAVVVMMSMVELPGDFFERLDALVVGIWFLSFFAFIDMLMHHSILCASRILGLKKKRYSGIAILAVMSMVTIACRKSPMYTEAMERLYLYLAVPLSLLIPAVACVRGHCLNKVKEG